jgi:hypothetical protein
LVGTSAPFPVTLQIDTDSCFLNGAIFEYFFPCSSAYYKHLTLAEYKLYKAIVALNLNTPDEESK